MIFAGLDPGASGAVAWMGESGQGAGFTCLGTGSPSDVAESLLALRSLGEVTLTIERVHTIPKMGIPSAFTFGVSWGVPRGVAAALMIPVRLVSAPAWRRWALTGRGMPQDRRSRDDLTIAAAREKWPALAFPRARKDQEAVAAALFLAAFPAALGPTKETV